MKTVNYTQKKDQIKIFKLKNVVSEKKNIGLTQYR